ncbi:MAG: VWA domain-containing protein [Verrucomicrobiota bacterium]
MKQILFAIGLALGLGCSLEAKETLSLKLEPEQNVVLSGVSHEVVVKIDLTAARTKKKKRSPLNLSVVLDRSGSMSGAKIEQARQAASGLVDQLAEGDIFSLVVYSTGAQVLVPAQRVEDKEELKRIISRIQSSGNTALYAGVEKGADELERYFSHKKINRVILLSDGLANIGPSSSQDLKRLGHRLAERGISVTTIGLGDDYNEDLMAGLAEASDANYYYVKDTEKLPEIFAKELGELLAVVARDVRIEIICPQGVTPLGLIGRTEKFENRKTSVTLSQFTPGQNRYLLLRCLVSENKPEVARVKVSYKDELDSGSESLANGVVKISYTKDRGDAQNSINNTVVAQKVLMLTAVAKDEATLQADTGKLRDASATLEKQAAELEAVYSRAPAAEQRQIRAESENLKTFNGALNRGDYNSATRKDVQSQTYNSRNSKSTAP